MAGGLISEEQTVSITLTLEGKGLSSVVLLTAPGIQQV